MKFETIEYIKNSLQRDKKIAAHNYKSIKDLLKETYGTEWLASEISESEKVMLDSAKEDYQKICAICDDFLEHQWQ